MCKNTNCDCHKKKCCRGRKGETGPQGQIGATGPQGQIGATGPQGEIGATGPQGECVCECICTEKVIELKIGGDEPFTQLDVAHLFTEPGFASIVAYGFENDGTPTDLSSRNTQGVDEEGLGIWDSCRNPNIHELDNQHFIQLDVKELAKFINNHGCDNPTIHIGSVQQGEGFELGGSYTLGNFGNQLYSFNNPNPTPIAYTLDLFNPAESVIPPPIYPYISVRAFPGGTDCNAGGDVVLDNITFYPCEFGSRMP